MSNIKLKSFNDFRNNEDYFTNLISESVTEDFAHTYNQYISPEHLEVKNIAHYKNYIDDFKKINDLRYSKEDFKIFITELTNIISCLNDLYLNIIEILVSSYEIDKDKLNLAVSQYFNNLYTIKQNYLSLNLNKTKPEKAELNNVYIFAHETFLFLQFQLNKMLFIDIDNTPLSHSYNNMLESFNNNIVNDFKYKQDSTNNEKLKLKDFIRMISEEKIEVFLNDLNNKMNPNSPKEFHLLANILYNKEFLIFTSGKKKLLHALFHDLFGFKIGKYKSFTRNFPKDIYKEIQKPLDNNYQLRKEINDIEIKLEKLLKNYRID